MSTYLLITQVRRNFLCPHSAKCKQMRVLKAENCIKWNGKLFAFHSYEYALQTLISLDGVYVCVCVSSLTHSHFYNARTFQFQFHFSFLFSLSYISRASLFFWFTAPLACHRMGSFELKYTWKCYYFERVLLTCELKLICNEFLVECLAEVFYYLHLKFFSFSQWADFIYYII